MSNKIYLLKLKNNLVKIVYKEWPQLLEILMYPMKTNWKWITMMYLNILKLQVFKKFIVEQ